MAERIPQSVAYLLIFKAYLTTTGLEATGQTIAITISKNGATSFSNPAVGATNATEMASGWYKVTLDTTDTNTLGPLAIRGAVSGILDVGEKLMVVNPNNAGLAAIPDTAVATNGSLITSGTGTAQLTVTAGLASANTTQIEGSDATNQIRDSILTDATRFAGANVDTTISSRTKPADTQAAVTLVTTTTNLTNAPTAGDLTATMKTSVTTAATAATPIAAAVSGNVGGNIVGNVNGNVVGFVGSVVGLTVANLDIAVSTRASQTSVDDLPTNAELATALTFLDVAVSSRMVTYTQPAGFLAATFPVTVASPTNITTVATVTNLTNAPANGDFTAVMKASLDASTPASIVGSVGSVVGLTVSLLDVAVSSRLASASYTAPDNTGIAAIDALTAVALDATVSSRASQASINALNNISVSDIFAQQIETSLTFLQCMRGVDAVLLGKVSGAATVTNTFRNAVDDTIDRIVATVDASGNRTAISYTL